MKTSNERILNKLSQLRGVKEHVDNNPNGFTTEIVKKKIANANLIKILSEHKIIFNQGTKRNPNWIWNTIIPNVKMAERVLHLQRELERGYYSNVKQAKRPRVQKTVYTKQSINDIQVIEEVATPAVEVNTGFSTKRRMYIDAILELNPEIRLHNGIMVTFEGDSVLITKEDKNIKTNDPVLFKQIAQVVSL